MAKVKDEKPKRHLSLTARISIAFLAVIIIPVIMIAVILGQPMSNRLRTLGESYGVDNLSYSGMSNNSNLVAGITLEALNRLKADAKEDPSRLEDPAYLQSFNDSITESKAFLVLENGTQIFFNGSSYPDSEMAKILSSYSKNENDTQEEWYTIHTGLHSLVMKEILNSGDNEYNAYVITDMNQVSPSIQRWLWDLVTISILVLFMAAMIMGMWLYASTVNPLNQLKKAARNIRDGNLDFKVESKGVTEISEVCEDFEEMRKRLKESEEEKLAVDKGNKELISNISHDLKTPLTAIRGYCEGIIDGVAATPEKMEKYVRTIYNKANEMDKLINELTFYSRIDTNRIPYTFTKIRIQDFFEDCVEDVKLETESRDIELTYVNELKDPDTLVIGDTEQLRRVINNIISNSIKYMDKPEKKMQIRLLDKDDFIQAEFEDNGKGIANSELSLIFERFYRTDASRNSTRGGSGIGLSIVKKIMEDHGGKVWATSTEGAGTTIHFVLRKYQEVIIE